MAPESRANYRFGYKSDIWKCGVLLFQLLCGYLPFDNCEDLDINYYENHFEGPEWSEISFLAKDLLDNLLEQDHEKRYSALEALQHPWITRNSPPPDIKSNDYDEQHFEE